MARYYKTNVDVLIKEIDGNYYIKNSLLYKDWAIPLDFFKELKTIRIKKNEFNRMLNDNWRNITDEWEYDGIWFKKLPNYTSMADTNNQPRHIVPDYHLPYEFIKVYHHGGVYYFYDVKYNGKGMLWDMRTMKEICWANIKNCAPILNKFTKEII